MKVRLPKSWDRLPESEKEAIAKVKDQEIDAHFAKLQKNWIMLSCIVLANYMGKSAEECMLYLANFREVYRQNSKTKSDLEQQEWLNHRLSEIFGDISFLDVYLQKLVDME